MQQNLSVKINHISNTELFLQYFTYILVDLASVI